MHLLLVAFTCSILCLLLRLDLTFFSTISYRDSQLMFFRLGNYLTHNSYWMKRRRMDLGKRRSWWNESLWKAKETKLCLSLSKMRLMNAQTPAAVLLHLINPYIPKKGTLWHNSNTVGPSKHFCWCCHGFSNILMSQKYHNIKNKCNPFTKQWTINNKQVVLLYCICTVYTQS